MSWSQQDARHFVDHEHAFRLGALPTEQPHPVTRRLSQTLQRDVTAGLRLLAQVDRDIPPAARRVFAGAAFASLVGQLERAMRQGRRIFFTGCGATGRLAILVESAWRRFWQRARKAGLDIPGIGEIPERVVSVMAGGDFALIRSVEGFEDYQSFGRHQLAQAGVSEGDVVVAVTEGGETSFVIGTAWEGLDRGASVFFVFNNPADTLAGLVERSRQVIEHPRITKLDLHSGPMAVAGSTRMQATTVELLVLAAAMEGALAKLLADQPGDLPARLGLARRSGEDYASQFEGLLDQLGGAEALEAMAGLVKLEEHIYRSKGLVTYFAQEYLLDILTDTTERSPTFALPPFRPGGDEISPPPWAFVKNLRLPTPQALEDLLGHRPRGLDWGAEVYRRLEAPRRIVDAPPDISNARILAFGIGDEDDPSRRSKSPNAAVALLAGRAAADPELARRFRRASAAFDSRAVLAIGASPPADLQEGVRLHVPCNWPDSPLDLWAHLAVKLVLNTLSTATMGRMKRLDGNWMIHVQPGNKKLIDRSCRLISTLAGVDYAQACQELFAVKARLEREPDAFGDAPAPAAIAMRRLRGHHHRRSGPPG